MSNFLLMFTTQFLMIPKLNCPIDPEPSSTIIASTFKTGHSANSDLSALDATIRVLIFPYHDQTKSFVEATSLRCRNSGSNIQVYMSLHHIAGLVLERNSAQFVTAFCHTNSVPDIGANAIPITQVPSLPKNNPKTTLFSGYFRKIYQSKPRPTEAPNPHHIK